MWFILLYGSLEQPYSVGVPIFQIWKLRNREINLPQLHREAVSLEWLARAHSVLLPAPRSLAARHNPSPELLLKRV